MIRVGAARTVRLVEDGATPARRAAGALAARIRCGDDEAFAELFLRYYAALCRFVDSYLHAPDVAEEVVQTVFLRIWEQRGTWYPQDDGRAFLFASCRNHALDLLRHERITARAAAADAHLALGRFTVSAPTDADLEAEDLARQLRAAVAKLPKRRRLVVVLRWQHQLSNPEIARVLGISVKGVEMQFSRALADLRRHFQRHGPSPL